MSFDGFPDRLRHIIKFGPYSQKEMAERAGISEHSITKYLNGRIPQAEILYRIALLYDTTMEWLLTGNEIDSQLLKELRDLTREDIHDLEVFLEFLKIRRERDTSKFRLIECERKAPKPHIDKSQTTEIIEEDDEPPITATKENDVVYLPILGNAAAGTPIEIIEMPQGKVAVNGKHSKYNSFIIRAQGDSMTGAGIEDGDLLIIHPQPVVENGQIALVNVDGSATVKYFFLYDGQCELWPSNPKYTPLNYSSGDIRVLGKVVEIIKQN